VKKNRRSADDLDSVLAKADPVVANLIKSLNGRLEDAEDRAERAEEIAKQERDNRENQAWISKAEKDFRALGATPTELGGLMKSLSEKAPAEAKAIEKLLRAANNQIAKSALFGEIGATGANTPTGAAVDGMVAELRKADPKLSYEQAMSRVYEQNPDLYMEELTERGQR
jgi:hypothetical protein